MHNVMYKKQDAKKGVINGFENTVDAKARVPIVFQKANPIQYFLFNSIKFLFTRNNIIFILSYHFSL